MPRTATADTVTREQLLAFLRPRSHALLATRRRDGGPQLSPVAAGVDAEGRVLVSTYPARAKVRNVRRDPQVSLCFLSEDWDDAWVQVQVIDDPGYWSKPSLAHGFQRVPGIGKEAYVVPEFGGWAAGALLEARLAVVSVAGGSSTRDRAVGLLQTVVSRLQ